MTIAISIKVNDGVVLAADSASTIIAQGRSGEILVQNVYTNADKVFNLLKGTPLGVMTWGIGSIGNESISTLMKDFRKRLSGEDQEDINSSQTDRTSVKAVAYRLREFIFEEKYRQAFQGWKNQPVLGFLVAGYSEDESMAEEYLVAISNGDASEPQLVRPQNDSGMSWHGEPEAITRLVFGYSAGTFDVLRNELDCDEEQIDKVKSALRQRPIQFVNAAMPIQDAVNLAAFLVETTISFSRFSPGATTVDGPVEIATITKHEGFKWIRRKHYYPVNLNS